MSFTKSCRTFVKNAETFSTSLLTIHWTSSKTHEAHRIEPSITYRIVVEAHGNCSLHLTFCVTWWIYFTLTFPVKENFVENSSMGTWVMLETGRQSITKISTLTRFPWQLRIIQSYYLPNDNILSQFPRELGGDLVILFSPSCVSKVIDRLGSIPRTSLFDECCRITFISWIFIV